MKHINIFKNKNYIKKSVIILCIIAAAITMYMGRYWSNTGDEFLQNLTIQLDSPLTAQALQSIIAEQTQATEEQNESTERSRECTAWTEWKEENVSEQTGSRQSSADIITVYGSSRCVLPFGKSLSLADKNGCIIGKELAEDLFGNFSAEGQKITWRDNTWIVRDVIETPSRMLMVQVNGKEEQFPMNRISLLLDNGSDRQLASDNFILQNGLSAHALRWDFLYHISWMQEMIPGEWSDFEQWKINLDTFHKTRNFVKNAEKSSIESVGIEYLKRSRIMILCSAAFCIAALLLIIIPPRKKPIS